MNENKSMWITLGITFLLFSFIIFLIYLVYCYAYYDEYQKNIYAEKFNTLNGKYIYDNMLNDTKLTYEDFNTSFNLMYDKNNLKNIYYLYYKDSGLFDNLDSFFRTFYYGNKNVNVENIEFQSYGKTNLFRRKSIDYKYVDVSSVDGYTSTLGVLHNIKFNIEPRSSLVLDKNDVECDNGTCVVDDLFGGLHTIQYKSNNINYYGIVNVNKNDQVIEVTNLDNLIRIEKDTENKSDSSEIKDASLNIGTYKLNECYLESGCPSKTKSYVTLYEDGSVDYYTYITLDIAGDTYHGTYTISGNFLILKFASHTYRVHDYDTKQYTDIEGRVDMEMRFKIEDINTIRSDSYQFKFSV